MQPDISTPTPPVAPTPVPTAPPVRDNMPSPARFNMDSIMIWVKAHKWWVLAIVIVVLVVAAAAAHELLHHKAKPAAVAPPPAAKVAAPTAATPILAPLTGLPTTAATAAEPVFGVVIENSPDARPQSGLSQAGVVYETLAEGGITRFMAVFQDQQPTTLGPVRSLRPYFIDWIQEYNNAPIAHAGGSDQALAEVPQDGVKSMNGLTYGSYFHRTSDRYAPHNLYTDSASLISLMQKNNWVTAPSFTMWKYKADAPEATPSHPSVTLNFSTVLYQAKYSYDGACDCYNRFIDGTPSIERNTGKQIQVKNVVAIVVQTSFDAKGHALDTTIGSGKAVVFNDGGATVGTWSKASRTGRTEFLDSSGQPIPLNAGNTWIGAIDQYGSMVY